MAFHVLTGTLPVLPDRPNSRRSPIHRASNRPFDRPDTHSVLPPLLHRFSRPSGHVTQFTQTTLPGWLATHQAPHPSDCQPPLA